MRGNHLGSQYEGAVHHGEEVMDANMKRGC